jgi:hypothetical protein
VVSDDCELIAGHFEHWAGKKAAHIISPTSRRQSNDKACGHWRN